MAGRSGGNEYEAMAEFAKQLWERYLIRRVKADLLNHSLDGYKATVETNNGDGTLTVRRPYDDTAMTLRCPPALAEEAQPGKQVLVIQLGDASNAFILCGTDLSGFGGGGGGGGESVDMLGDIAQLTADSLSTSGRIRKYFLQDTSDDAFLRIRGENIEYIVGSVTSQTPVQAQDRYGRLLYWEAQPAGHLPDGSPVDIAGDRIYSTYIVTDWPVYTYTYTDAVQATYVRSTRTVNGYPLSSDVTLNASDVGAQSEILVNGILKGDGAGGISAATPGTDYGTYSKPSGGIPSTDMTSAVQTSLGKADTAYQKPSGGIPASDLANGVIPTVPSASTANPQMDGTASPGSTGNWSDGGHVHPTDTSRAAAALEINGHPLTGDFDLTAADVDALASNGTAVAARTLAQQHKIFGSGMSEGWYAFAEITISNNLSRTYDILIDSTYHLSSATYQSGILRVYFSRTSGGVNTANVKWLATQFPLDYVRWVEESVSGSGKLTLYIYKAANASGSLAFRCISATDREGDAVALPTWLSTAVAEPTQATAASGYLYNQAASAVNDGNGNNIADGVLRYSSVAVSAGTAQQILSISDAKITADYVLAEISFADPAYITGGGSWASSAGSFTLTGTATAATTADILLVRKGN